MEIWHENSLAGEAGHNFILDKLILYDQTGDGKHAGGFFISTKMIHIVVKQCAGIESKKDL